VRYVIAYDVSDDGRRSRLARFLEGWGRRVQKSVFECDLSADELRRVHRRISELIEVSEDRCHIYRLCGECVPERLVLGSELELQLEGPIVL
jgi:CRISPR-associated protein Cas2